MMGPKVFEPVNDPSAGLFTHLYQNLFHLRGLSEGRTFTRVLNPIGCKSDPNALYVILDKKKPFGVADFFSTVGKILLIVTGIFPLILLAAHLIDYQSKKRRYVVVDGNDEKMSSVIRVLTGENKAETNKGSRNSPPNPQNISSSSSSRIPSPMNLIMEGALLASLSDEQLGQITLGQMGRFDCFQHHQFAERMKTYSQSLESSPGSYSPPTLGEISVSQLSKLNQNSIERYMTQIPPFLWHLLPGNRDNGLGVALRNMSQGEFERCIMPHRLGNLELLNPELYADKLSEPYIRYLNQGQVQKFVHLLPLERLQRIDMESIPAVDMKTISLERLQNLLDIHSKDCDGFKGDRVRKLTSKQIHDCLTRPELAWIKETICHFTETQLQGLSLEDLSQISEKEWSSFAHYPHIFPTWQPFNVDQMNILLNQIGSVTFTTIPADLAQKLDYSKFNQKKFENFFCTGKFNWYEGLHPSFIQKMLKEDRLSLYLLANLPDMTIYQLDMAHLANEYKKAIRSSKYTFNASEPNSYNAGRLRNKCSRAQIELIESTIKE